MKKICLLIETGALATSLLLTTIFYFLIGNTWVIIGGIIFSICFTFWLFLLIWLFGKRLSLFTFHLCHRLDNMINGYEKEEQLLDEDTLLSRISYRLSRLYDIKKENQNKVANEREKLQILLSDISHQVKTPISNLKMITDTLLTKSVSDTEREEFLQGIKGQVNKLDFLIQVMVKTSRLETGAIKLEKNDNSLYQTLAIALSSIVYPAEEKSIYVTVNCPENLRVLHDSKWTAEAFFNLLDNAVKYTPTNGKINVSAEEWEMYIKVDIKDTGKGIPEKHQASIFQRFYREEEVHNEPGIGIGLYLAREIITKQGGFIKVTSEVDKGSTFSVFLPKK